MRNAALREDVRTTILDAADRLITHYGYKKTTIEDISREAGIGKGTVYLYFKSKEEMALCNADRMIERVIAHLKSISHCADSPVNRLRRMLVGRVMYRFDGVQQYTRVLDEVLHHLRAAVIARRETWMEQEAVVFAEVLIEGRLLGTFSTEDARATARSLLRATNAFMPANLTSRELENREEVLVQLNQVVDLLLGGVLCREPMQAP
jgi:AcrR family transcriptional regulator